MLQVPSVVRNKASALGATAWLEALPELLRHVELEWCLVVGQVFGDATEALVAEATLEDGSNAVAKLPIPGYLDYPNAVSHEVTFFRLDGGHGCARVLRADEDRGILLLERLGRSLHDLALPIGRRHEILCATAQQVWRPAAGCGLPTGADKGRWLAKSIPPAREETVGLARLRPSSTLWTVPQGGSPLTRWATIR